ncbi:MAG: preprotein translocase subunit SecG [Terrimicrobiaceae bacterium]
MSLLIGVLLVIHVVICAILVCAVLMQLPRSEGLGAAFGGGAAENVFGAQTTHVLAKLTVWLGVGFFVVTLFLAIAFAHNQPSTSQFEQKVLSTTTAPAETTPADPASTTPGEVVAPAEVTTETVEVTAEAPASTELNVPALNLQPEAVPTPTPILDPSPATP